MNIDLGLPYILLGVMLLILEVLTFGLSSKASHRGRYAWVFGWISAWAAYVAGAFYVVQYV